MENMISNCFFLVVSVKLSIYSPPSSKYKVLHIAQASRVIVEVSVDVEEISD